MNSLLVETRDKSTLYAPILYWSGARHWAISRLGSSNTNGLTLSTSTYTIESSRRETYQAASRISQAAKTLAYAIQAKEEEEPPLTCLTLLTI
jgi:hypothetical protein